MLSVDTHTVMRGRLVAAGRIVLSSWFEGEVICSRLEIGPGGYVLGTVVAREVFVEGQIVGPVHAGQVHLLPGGFIEGDIRYVTLEVTSGSTHCGRCSPVKALQMPPELIAIEARAAAEARDMAQIERTAIRRPARLEALRSPRSLFSPREAVR